jgi:hypothetical protein
MSKTNRMAAFPINTSGEDNNGNAFYPEEGMSLRDYFAAKAMVALMRSDGFTSFNDSTAKEAFVCADMMLLEREK